MCKDKVSLGDELSMGAKSKVMAIYNEGVLKPMEKLDLPEKAQVRLTISRTFSKLLDDIGEIEAKDDTDEILEDMRARAYYE